MIVGIDLGTTNSLVAYYTEEGPKIIPNRLGKPMTPSVVSMDEEGQIYVGESAAEQMLLIRAAGLPSLKEAWGAIRDFPWGTGNLQRRSSPPLCCVS